VLLAGEERRRREKEEREGGRKKKREKEKGKKEKKKRKGRGKWRELSARFAAAEVAAATAGPVEHVRRSVGRQRAAWLWREATRTQNEERKQKDGTVIGTGVGTAGRRERFWEIRNSDGRRFSSTTKIVLKIIFSE